MPLKQQGQVEGAQTFRNKNSMGLFIRQIWIPTPPLPNLLNPLSVDFQRRSGFAELGGVGAFFPILPRINDKKAKF